MVITRTPFRISFFGGGTDYPAWYREHGGAVLATAIDKYCYISCRYLPPFFDHHSRIIYTQVENVAANQEIRHPAVRACLGTLGIEAGVEIHHDADLPARTGLGTSSAFVVGLLHALHSLRQQRCSPEGLAREAVEIEQVVMQENVGAQDQVTAAHGGFNLIRFGQDGSIRTEPVALTPQRRDELQAHLHLYFTGFSRTASEIAAQQIANIPRRTSELKEMTAMVEEAYGRLGNHQPLAEFGQMLHQAWMLKRRLSERVSNAAIDGIYERARAAGALGGKLLGAGGGGFLLFFVPPDLSVRFQQAMAPLMRVPFSVHAPGSHLVLAESQAEFEDTLVAQRLRAYSASGC